MKKPTGLTNKIVLNDNILTKYSNKQVDYFLNRKYESYLYDFLKNKEIDFIIKPIKWGFDKSGNWSSSWKYINNTFTLEDTNEITINNDVLKKVIKLIDQYHQIEVAMPVFDPKIYLNKFRKKIKQPLFDLSKYDQQLNSILEHYYDEDLICLSHNDMVSGNFLFVNDKQDILLIDFEYSSLNHYLFDYASFITETLNGNHEKEFIKLLNLTDLELKKLNDIILYQYILWINWSNYMYETTKKAIYKEIALFKYSLLIEKY